MSSEIDVSNAEINDVLTNKLSFSRTEFVCFGLKIKFFILVLKNKNNNLHLIVNFILFFMSNYIRNFRTPAKQRFASRVQRE